MIKIKIKNPNLHFPPLLGCLAVGKIFTRIPSHQGPISVLVYILTLNKRKVR